MTTATLSPNQLTMTGDDWLSSQDKKAIARALATRKKAASTCAKKLQDAVDALNALMRACNECDDGSGVRSADDGRVLLVEQMMEYANWLDSVYNK